MKSKHLLLKTQTTIFLLVSISILFSFMWVLWYIKYPLKVIVKNESKVDITEANIYFYQTDYDSKRETQVYREHVVYKFTKEIESSDTSVYYPNLEIVYEGGLGFSYTDKNGHSNSQVLCSYIDSTPTGKFKITIDDKGKIILKKSGILMCN